jgi:hypothetical protein
MTVGFPASFWPNLLAAAIVAVATSPSLHAADAAKQVLLTAQVGPASSLRVSPEPVVFTLLPGQERATAAIEYLALVRTARDAEVLLILEPVEGIECAGGAADVEAALSFDSGGGPRGLLPGAPTLAARWMGSGSRSGQITLTLRAALAGVCVVPLRLQLVLP